MCVFVFICFFFVTDIVYIIIRIRIRIFIIPINGPTIGANKLHTLIIVIGGNYTYKYKKYINTMFLVGFRALKKLFLIII